MSEPAPVHRRRSPAVFGAAFGTGLAMVLLGVTPGVSVAPLAAQFAPPRAGFAPNRLARIEGV
jgi:hypothetical protein